MLIDLYKDPLTGFTNLFGLLESDLDSICGDNGTILYMDMKALHAVNEEFGMHMGDIYIKNTAEVISGNTAEHCSYIMDSRRYRVGGDEFIVIFPLQMEVDADRIADRIDSSLKQRMMTYNITYAGIRWVAWTYFERIGSLPELLKQCLSSMARSEYFKPFPTELPGWANHFINNLFDRIRETLHLLQQANNLALNDEVSQLPNYRAASLYLKDAHDEFSRLGKSFSVLFIDGDNLKKYNELGYQCGNDMIRKLGSLISGSVRDEDRVFRWLSGDEFLVLLKDTGKSTAFIVAERIREHVEKEAQSWIYPVTVSTGVACCPEDGSDIDTVIARAELSNFQAKKSGKNRVI